MSACVIVEASVRNKGRRATSRKTDLAQVRWRSSSRRSMASAFWRLRVRDRFCHSVSVQCDSFRLVSFSRPSSFAMQPSAFTFGENLAVDPAEVVFVSLHSHNRITTNRGFIVSLRGQHPGRKTFSPQCRRRGREPGRPRQEVGFETNRERKGTCSPFRIFYLKV